MDPRDSRAEYDLLSHTPPGGHHPYPEYVPHIHVPPVDTRSRGDRRTHRDTHPHYSGRAESPRSVRSARSVHSLPSVSMGEPMDPFRTTCRPTFTP